MLSGGLDGTDYVIKAVRGCRGAVVRPEWDCGLHLYPIAKFNWEQRADSTYGESEITNLIPNQIAINRMLTASVWAVMVMGMPIMIVNGDVIHQPVTNNPGQIISFCGSPEEFDKAINYVTPPDFSPNFDSNINSLINNTLSASGVTDAVLGNLTVQNQSAVNSLREAAIMPLDMFKKRYLSFVEDIAKIWADFFFAMYGKRALKQEGENGIWYLPFDAKRYRDIVLCVSAEVVSNGTLTKSQILSELDMLLDKGVISGRQYLERVPKGVVPDTASLINEMKEEQVDECENDL